MNTQQDQPLLVLAGVPMSQAEYNAAQKNVRRVSRLFRFAWPVTTAFLALMALAVAAETAGEARMLTVVGWLLFAAVLTVITAVTKKKRENEALSNMYGVYRRMRGDTPDQVRFYRDHLETVSDRRRLAIPYSEIQEFWEDAEKFVLYADQVLVVLPARTLTPAQAQTIYNTLAMGLPAGRMSCKERLRPMLIEPLPVPDFPARPVVPPKALHEPPSRLTEHQLRGSMEVQLAVYRPMLVVTVGLLTGLLLDPIGALPFADGLCVVAWMLLSQLVLTLFAKALAKSSPPTLLGLSPQADGVTVYIRGGEMFVPRELLSVRESREGLLVQTPLGPICLRYASLPDPEAVKRYFGL
ncbi:MAG: YcxB family protein [Clostridia bacterium]|nr:YcxB family protein [Clostridia bacterium]